MTLQQHFAPGLVIEDRYKIEKLLGIGGAGQVFLALDLQSGETVAIKVLHQEGGNFRDQIKRFTREATLSKLFNHPNVLSVKETRSLRGTTIISWSTALSDLCEKTWSTTAPLKHQYWLP